MNILVVYPFLLHTRVAHGGGTHMLRRLRELSIRGHQIDLLSLAEIDPTPYSQSINELKVICRKVTVMRRPPLNTWRKLTSFLSPTIPPHARNIWLPQANEYIQQYTSSGTIPCVILAESATGVYLPAIDRQSSAVIVDTVEIETRRYRMVIDNERNPLHWLHALITWFRERSFERRIFKSVDQVICITSEEQVFAQNLAPNTPIAVIPPIIDIQSFSQQESEEPSTIVFLGSFAHRPNLESIEWFNAEVFPHILQACPQARLYLIGWNAQHYASKLSGPQVTIVDSVPDVRPWLAKAMVFISPIQSGGGARIKNLEALAMACPLVTTPLGAEGLAGHPGIDYLVARDATSFAEAVISLLQNEPLRRAIGQAGRRLVEQEHAASAAGILLENLLQVAVERSRIKLP